jgi:hypothetical protein
MRGVAIAVFSIIIQTVLIVFRRLESAQYLKSGFLQAGKS